MINKLKLFFLKILQFKKQFLYKKDKGYSIWVCSIQKKFYIQMKDKKIGKVGYSTSDEAIKKATK